MNGLFEKECDLLSLHSILRKFPVFRKDLCIQVTEYMDESSTSNAYDVPEWKKSKLTYILKLTYISIHVYIRVD